MKKYLLCILIFSFCISNAKAMVLQKEDASSLFKCDSQTVFLCVLCSQKLNHYFPPSLKRKYYDSVNHEIHYTNNEDSLTKDINFYYNNAKQSTVILKTISDWCTANRFMDSIGNQSTEYPPEAILYNTKETKYLFSKFIKSSDQTWESLSSFQLYELNVNFLKHVEKLTLAEKKSLFKKLAKTCKQIPLK